LGEKNTWNIQEETLDLKVKLINW